MKRIEPQWVEEGSATRMGAPLVLALHGQGMSGESLAKTLAPLFTLPVRFVLPTAARRSPEGRYPGPSWYDYDGNQERFLIELGSVEEDLLGFLEQVESRAGWKPRARVLFGFSQGGYCGAYVVLRHSEMFQGLVVSGARVKTEILAEPLRQAAKRGFEVLLCHGRRDRHVPFEAARSSYEALSAAGLSVTLRPFAGGHSIGTEQVAAIRLWLVHLFQLG